MRVPALSRRACAWLPVFLLFCCVAPVKAQILGELKGQVTDPSGAVVPGASVTLTQSATKIATHTVSTSAGEYDFSQLTSGTYSVRVERSGFAAMERRGVTVTTGQTVRVDLRLKPGSAQESVTVNGDEPLLQAETSDVATTIRGREIVALPLNSRNFVQLTQLTPGVELPPGTLLPRINGGRPRTNEYLYDGISALQPEPGQVAFFPIVDDIAEFTIESDNVPAEFGRFNGGVVNVSTRSGSNEVHGSVFEFFRNEDLNARNYFSRTGPKPEYRRNLYGATLGAPIRHDKLFFFGDYQGIKQRVGVTRISTVPTEAERAGNFSGVAKIYDPCATASVSGGVSRPEFAGDVIDTSLCPIDPRAQFLLNNFIPHPTSPGTSNNFSYTGVDDDHQNQFDVRVDGAFGAHDRGFARYSYYHEVENPVTPFPNGNGAIAGSVIGTGNVTSLSDTLGQQVVINETHVFAPTLLNDFRLGYTRRGNTQLGVTLASAAGAALGIPGIPLAGSYSDVMPQFTFTGYQQLGSKAGSSERYQTAVGELVDTVVWSHGKHSVKAGLDARRYELNAFAPGNPTGSFQFTTTGTDTTVNGKSAGGNAFASFLLGQVDTYNVDLQSRTIRPRDYIYESFAQDDWRVTPKLTLNLGARWTLHLPSTETHNQGAVFNLATQRLDFLGQDGYSRSARELHWDNVAPRLGFAYSVDAKTVVRSGFGIVFIDQSGITTPFTTPEFPFVQSPQQKTVDGYTPTFLLHNGPTVQANALTPDAGLGQSVYTATRSAGSGYVEQWNLAVQRALTTNLSFEVGYVGTHIVHVGIPDENLNQLTDAQLAMGSALLAKVPNPYAAQIAAVSPLSPLAAATLPEAQLLKPYPRFQNVAIYRNNTGNTNYNALEAKVEQRVTHGLFFLLSYTHSKLMDDASSVFSSTVLSSPNSSSLNGADVYRPYLERGVSNGDMPNVLSASATYELAKFRGHALLTPVLGGWSVNGIFTMQSGMPVNVTQGTNYNSFAGVVMQRPNEVANPVLPKKRRTPQHWFNTAAFVAAPQFTFGNTLRNPVRGAPYRDLDMALVKHTAVTEKTDLEFRAEVFDVTNTPAFGAPNGTQGTAAFGTITTTVTDPRVVQFALRLSR